VVNEAAWGLTSAPVLEAEAKTTLTFDWFYFPGWWAKLDGRELPVLPSNAAGSVDRRCSKRSARP
jgi:hypothetical protein